MLSLQESIGLDGKCAIVAGGGASGEGIGNGRAAALLLARAGAKVLVVDREAPLAERTAQMIREQGGVALAHGADLTHEAQCQSMVELAMKQFGRVDILDNNVGIASHTSVVHETQAHWARVMQVNVEVMFLTSKSVIPAMVEGGQGGPSSIFLPSQPCDHVDWLRIQHRRGRS